MASTANYGWTKPAVGGDDDAWGGEINTDLDGIDSVVHGIQTSKYDAANPSGYQTAANVTAALAPYALTTAIPAPSSTTPIMDGTAAVGTGTTWARADHVHPKDTTKYDTTNPAGYQTAGQVNVAIAAAAYVLPTASTTVLGGVRVDGSTITIAGGVISGAPASAPPVTISDTAPASPAIGALWWDSVGGQLYVWFNDGNSSQWVAASTAPQGAQGAQGAPGATGATGAPGAAGPNTLPMGVTDGSNAIAGQIGEVISDNSIPSKTLTSNNTFFVASVPLTPGDWDVSGEGWFVLGTGGATALNVAITPSNSIFPTTSSINQSKTSIASTFAASSSPVISPRPCRVNVSIATTYYVLVFATFPSGTCTATGIIWARRAR